MKSIYFLLIALFLLPGILAQGDWTILTPSNSPSPRAGHSIIPMPDGSAMVFGGGDDAGNVNNELYSYSNNAWTSVATSTKPPARRDHASWFYNGKLYIHGGKISSQQSLDDLWSYDTVQKQWAYIPITGQKPPSRYGHLATVLANGSVIFTGGSDCTGVRLKDTWQLNTDNTFSLISICPIPMSHHVGNLIGDVLWLFAGAEKFVTFNVPTKTWSTNDGGPALLRYSSSALAQNEQGESIITIFGGMKYDNTESNVVYEYNVNRLVLAERQQPMQFPLLFASSAALVGDRADSAGIKVLFFGGVSNGKCINTTFQFSTKQTPPQPVSGIVTQIGALGNGSFALLFVQFPTVQSKVTIKLKWEQTNAQLSLMTIKAVREEDDYTSIFKENDMLNFTMNNASRFEVEPLPKNRTEIEKTLDNVKFMAVLIKHQYRTGIAKNIELTISKSENNPQYLCYVFPVGKFAATLEPRHHFVNLPVKPVRWFSRYPSNAVVQETIETGENFWKWNAIDSTIKNFYSQYGLVQFFLP